MACLDELRKQQAIDQYVHDQKLIEDTIENSHGRGIREQVMCWILKSIQHTERISFRPIFIVFIDHRITCRRVEELHILNDIGTLGT